MSPNRVAQTRIRRKKPATSNVSVRIPSEWESKLVEIEVATLLDVSALVRVVCHSLAKGLEESRTYVLLPPRPQHSLQATLSVALRTETLELAKQRIEKFEAKNLVRLAVALLFRVFDSGAIVIPFRCGISGNALQLSNIEALGNAQPTPTFSRSLGLKLSFNRRLVMGPGQTEVPKVEN